LSLVLVAAACSGRAAPVTEVPSRYILTREQVIRTNSLNLYDAIQALRLNWLQPKGVDSFRTPGQVQVYYNNIRLGGVDVLRQIPLVDVGYVRYFEGIEAAGRWGLDHGHGVIYIAS